MNPGRICLGKHFALQTMYLVIASVLSAFDIEPALDDNGNPRMPKPEFDNTTVRYVFLKPLVRTAIDVDRLVTPLQSSQIFRMYYQTPF